MVGWLEFNVPLQHKYGYIRDEATRNDETRYGVDVDVETLSRCIP